MKRLLKIIAFLIASIILVSSCESNQINNFDSDTTNTDNTSSENSRFLYTIEGGRLVCYDVVEQKETIACPDPLCEHNTEDCTASDVYLVHITDDYIAIVKEVDDGWEYNLYLYDLTSGEISTIMLNISQIYYPWISINREYVFFSASILLYDDNGNSTDEIWYVYRYNIESGELETIDDGEAIVTGYRVIEDTGSSLVWYTNFTGTYYTSDYDFKNFEEYDYIGETVGNYYIYSDINYTDYGDYYRTVYREDKESGEVEQILDNVSEMRYDNKYSPSGLAYAMFDYNEEYGYNAKSEIWYYDFETGESRLLIDVKDISDEFDTFHITSYAGYNDYAGGYMMIHIGHTYTFVNEEGEEEMSQTGSMNLFINPETGDWFIMEPLY